MCYTSADFIPQNCFELSRVKKLRAGLKKELKKHFLAKTQWKAGSMQFLNRDISLGLEYLS